MAETGSKDVAAVAATLFQGVHKGSTAYRLLSKMGWKEGQGLGAKQQGITTHVKVKKKLDAMGVGMAENTDRQRDWTTGMVNFDLILSRLKEVAAKHEQPAKQEGTADDDTSCSSSSSEDEKPAARGNKKQSQPPKKKKGTSKAAAKAAVAKESSTSSSSSDDESDAAQKPGAGAKLATHVGRYHRRERAKSVRGYSAGDLAAILGSVRPEDGAAEAPPMNPADAAWAPVGAREVQASHEEQEDSDDSSSGPAKCGDEHEAQPNSRDPSAPRSWWSGLFVKAGRMGSTKHELHSRKVKGTAGAAVAKPSQPPAASQGTDGIKITGFSEQDQENLYEKVHLGATHGKQGLGRGSAPKKVAGAHWSGTKTKLGSDSEGEEEEGVEGGGDDSTSSDEADDAVVLLASKKEQAAGHVEKEVVKLLPAAAGGRQANGSESSAPTVKSKGGDKDKSSGKKRKSVEEPVLPKSKVSKKDKRARCEDSSVQPGEVQNEEKVKWTKLARDVLKAAPSQKLKLHLLSKRVLKAAGLEAGGCDKKLMKKLKSLPQKFELGETFVRLL